MAFGCELRAPHGGIWVIGLITNPLLYVVAILAGTVLAGFLVTPAEVAELGHGRGDRGALTHAAVA